MTNLIDPAAAPAARLDEDARHLPRIVVIGGGFGGIETVRNLAHAKAEITLVDRQNHHCFQPLLYQVATATLSPADIAWPIRGIVGRQRNVTVLMAEVTGIDAQQRRVHTTTGDIPYDILVLATGATHSYFGHDDWAAFAPGLKRIDDATNLRRRVLLAFERAEQAEDPDERKRLMTFAIIGGGPTGVEMAGAIAELAHQALPLDFRHIDPRDARVALIEAGPRILPALPENLSAYAERTLTHIGVEVMTKTRVIGCDDAGVDLEGGRFPAATLIWAAGVRASPAAEWLGIASDHAGRIIVGPDLSVPGFDTIYAIGDTAHVDHDGGAVPGIAPAAKQMGHYIADLVAKRLDGKPPPAPFAYRHQGDLATIGRKAAVVKMNRFEVTGFLGWIFWGLVHVYFLIGSRNRLSVAVSWLWNYVTLQRQARLITGPGVSPAKPPVRK